ncbi:MAG: methionyl-tRNA formyltransferase [Legionella sp.]|uniref:methionyl-tRNA formyltransferase n=1 Tax=Legionella sp. TaxID=459 RepID=UPI0028418CBF|nr:methionyl-tRNA formyltransferase [Legionella sp.]
MKIIFFGTANVALPILEVLNKSHQVLAAVTKPDAPAGRSGKPQESPVSALATDLNLKIFKPDKVKGNAEFLTELQNMGADIFVVVAYGKILPGEIIGLPPYKTVNVHFSALPKYRGPSPIQAALLNGDPRTGTSIFILDEGVDDGPLLAQEIVGIEPDDNYFTLSDKLAKKSAAIIIPTLEGYVSGRITPLPQDGARASHSGIISKSDGKINWNKSASEIYNQFRAFFIWPGIWTTWNGKILKITYCLPKAGTLEISSKTESAGTVLSGGNVVCGNSTALQLKQLQLEGKSEVGIDDFLNGYRAFTGSRLE